MDVRIRVCRRGEVRVVTRRRAPRVGSYVKVNGQPGWLVVSMEYPLEHRLSTAQLSALWG